MDPLDEFPTVDYNRSTDPKIVQMWKSLETKWKVAIAILILLAIIIMIALIGLAIRIFLFSSLKGHDENPSDNNQTTNAYIPSTETPEPTGLLSSTPSPKTSPEHTTTTTNSPSALPSPTASPSASSSPASPPAPSSVASRSASPSPTLPYYYTPQPKTINVPSVFTSTVDLTVAVDTEQYYYLYGQYGPGGSNDTLFNAFVGGGTLASDNQFNKTKLYIEGVLPWDGTEHSILNVYLDNSSYTLTQQQCYPSDDKDFIAIFDWVEYAPVSPDHVQINDIDCVVAEFDFLVLDVSLYVDSNSLSDATQRPVRFRINIDGVIITFDFKDFIPNVANLDDLSVPDACGFIPTCDQGDIATEFVYLEDQPMDQPILADRTAFDRAGLAFKLCYDILALQRNISDNTYPKFSTNVDSTWGRFDDCSAISGCDESSGLVGRRITMGYTDDELLGQCAANSTIGFEYSFPSSGQCQDAQVGVNGCTWTSTLKKIISGSCLLEKGIKGTCSNDRKANPDVYIETIGLLDDAFSGSDECADLSQEIVDPPQKAERLTRSAPLPLPFPLPLFF